MKLSEVTTRPSRRPNFSPTPGTAIKLAKLKPGWYGNVASQDGGATIPGQPPAKVQLRERIQQPVRPGFRRTHQPTIAIDLDGTLTKEQGRHPPGVKPPLGEPRDGAKEGMERFRELGYRTIIYTVRGDNQEIKSWLMQHQIPFDHINYNPDQPPDSSGKIIADVYVDDRVVSARDNEWPAIVDAVIACVEDRTPWRLNSINETKTVKKALRLLSKSVSKKMGNRARLAKPSMAAGRDIGSRAEGQREYDGGQAIYAGRDYSRPRLSKYFGSDEAMPGYSAGIY